MRLPDHDNSDWERVMKESAEDAPVPFDPNDADETPYDPNDDEAVEHVLNTANRVDSNQKRIRKAS